MNLKRCERWECTCGSELQVAPAARLSLPQVNIQLVTVVTTYRWKVFVVSLNAMIEQHLALTSLKKDIPGKPRP